MQCVERGLLSLDSDISDVLPEWKSPDILLEWRDGKPSLVKAKNKITLRLLLTHSSGMGYEFLNGKLMEWFKYKGIDMKSIEGDIVRSKFQPLRALPGSLWLNLRRRRKHT